MNSPLPRTPPERQGLSSAAVERFLDTVDTLDGVELHSLMIIRHATVVAEGWWHPYRRDELHLLYSLSKSFTSAAAGLAAAEGFLSLDDRVIDIFPDLSDAAADDRVRRTTLRQLLRMASGHREDALAPAHTAAPDDLVRGFLATPPDEEPGSIFCYNNAATFVVGAAVQRVTAQTLTEFLTPRLFQPLGIERLAWSHDGRGRNLGFSGLHLTTEAVARFGQLILQGGRWGSRQLLDPDWLAAATSFQTDNSDAGNPDWTQGYGYQFWMSRHGFRGDGAYGQFCLILPEQDTVIVTTAATADMHGFLTAVWQHLLPAFHQEALPDDPTGHHRLTERLNMLALAPVGSPGWSRQAVPGAGDHSWSSYGPVRVTAIDHRDDHVLVTLEHDDQQPDTPSTFCCTPGRWQPDILAVGDRRLPAAGRAQLGDDGITDVELIMLQTPHRLRIRHHPDGRTESGWLTEPLRFRFPEQFALAPVDLTAQETTRAPSGR